MSAVHEDWSVARFETERPELCAFLKNGPIAAMEKNCPRILIRAPVKSGKRQMVQYIARRDSAVAQQRVHGFVSAWHRAADESQRKEMGPYGVQVWSGLDQKKVKGFNTWVTLRIKQGKHIVLHLDECDHGSGERQILGEIWRRWNKHERVTFILYSATPEEVIYSSEIEDEDDAMLQEMITEGLRFNYTPPAGFCGPQRFLRENLVHEAKPFFVKTDDGFSLSAQGKEIVAQMLASMAVDRRRNVLVLRLTYSEGGGKRAEKKDNKAIYQFLRNIKAFPELSSFDISVDKGEGTMSFADVTTEKIQWSSKKWWDRLTTDKPFMFVCDQTSSRSTEWAFHDRVYATHDYRNQLTFSVASQAQERVSHYESKYGGCFQPIKVYGHKKTFQLSAGEIDYETYLNDEWEKRKLDKRKTGDQELYQIRKTADKTPHPAYPQPVSELEANRILQDLGCLAESTLSARVRGRIGLVPVVESTFVPCTKESFETLRAAGKFGQGWANTFIAAEKLGLVNGKYQGKIRGTIAVRTYDEVIREIWAVSNSHTHHQIVCYKDDECGICVRKVVGQESMDRLTAYKSMYAPRR